MLFYIAFPVIVAGVAAVMDIRTAKVDNGWLLFCLMTELSVRYVTEGTAGIWHSLPGIFLPVLLLGGLFCFRMLGPGDIKLFCTLGAAFGPARILKCILFSFLIGAVIAAAILVLNGNICQRLQYLINYIREFRETGRKSSYYQKGMAPENFHFTVPVFLSAILGAGGLY